MNQQPSLRHDCPEQVILQYSDMVYRLAFAKTGTRHHADDVFQEVSLRYVKKKPAFVSEAHRKARFIRVTTNCSNNIWASLWYKKTLPLSDEIAFETKETVSLHAELQQLPPKYREVIHLFYYEDMSLEAISVALNRKSATVRTQLTRAEQFCENL